MNPSIGGAVDLRGDRDLPPRPPGGRGPDRRRLEHAAGERDDRVLAIGDPLGERLGPRRALDARRRWRGRRSGAPRAPRGRARWRPGPRRHAGRSSSGSASAASTAVAIGSGRARSSSSARAAAPSAMPVAAITGSGVGAARSRRAARATRRRARRRSSAPGRGIRVPAELGPRAGPRRGRGVAGRPSRPATAAGRVGVDLLDLGGVALRALEVVQAHDEVVAGPGGRDVEEAHALVPVGVVLAVAAVVVAGGASSPRSGRR